MSATNRAALFGKIHKVLKKHYEPVFPPSDRTALEHLLYACVLENAKPEDVDEVFAKLQKNYFDWNEVRVTSVQELAEVMSAVPDAAEAAKRMKRALQSVFEKYYQFDIDLLRKAGLGKAVEALQKFNGVTPFVIDYMTQNALGGHAVPTNTAALAVLLVLDGVNPADAAKNRVPGLERAIPKNKGPEFSSLLHQFAVDFGANPQSTRVKSIVAEIDPSAKDRLPKKAPTPPPAPAPIKRVLPPPVIPPGGKPPLGGKPLPAKPAPESASADKTDKSKGAKPDSKKVMKPSTPHKDVKPVKIEGKAKSAATGLTRKKPK
jgi:endonuclease III